MLTFFETWNKGELPNLNKHYEADFACLKSMGVEAIRLPIHFELLMEPYDTGTIYDFVLEKLDQVCDWAEKYQIYLIIDDHSFNTPEYDLNPPSVQLYKEHLESVWRQIASRYNNRSKYIIYEILNEPKSNGEIASKWIKLQQGIIDLIRSYDPERDIVVTSADFSSIDTLVKMKPYKDPNLIYSFHFYEPMLFTHQGATWVGKGMANTSDIPFPYERARMPKLNKEAAADGWVQSMYNEYYNIGTAKYINQRIKKAADWGKKNNVRIFCGEIGAKVWTNPVDRLAWINTTRTALEANKISYCCWGLDGSDGFLKSDKAGMIFPDDIDEAVTKAYGFNMPSSEALKLANDSLKKFPQKPYIVYDEVEGKFTSAYPFNTKITKVSDSHERCFVMSYPQEQASIDIYLLKAITSKFKENEKSLVISFDVKFTDKSQSFEVLLVDSDGGKKELPWTKRYDLKACDYALNKWITAEIPVSRFDNNWGAWSNVEQAWYDLPCEFTWSRFEKLTFNFNDHTGGSSKGELYIDNIVIKKK